MKKLITSAALAALVLTAVPLAAHAQPNAGREIYQAQEMSKGDAGHEGSVAKASYRHHRRHHHHVHHHHRHHR